MTANWYLVQYMPDLRRREPRNVGIVLRTPEGWYLKFFAESADGVINDHMLSAKQLTPEVYKTWVDYYRRKAQADVWADVERMQSNRVGNFVAAYGGIILRDPPSWKQHLDQLFTELVDDGTMYTH